MCTVHYNRGPVTSATPHVWNQNSLLVQIIFISSHEIEHSFSNKAEPLIYQRLRCRTKRRLCNTRCVADSSLVHSSTLIPPHVSEPLTIVKITHFSATYIFVDYCTYLHDDDAIWPWRIVEINHFSATHLFLAHTVISAQRWWHLTMTIFYRHLSNCQPHHAVHISVASTTVLTTMTTHNTALGTTVPNAPHFLCPAKVSAHICLPLTYITIDQ